MWLTMNTFFNKREDHWSTWSWSLEHHNKVNPACLRVVQHQTFGPRGTGSALRQVAPLLNGGSQGLQRFPWRWHPINHSQRFSSCSSRATGNLWTRGREAERPAADASNSETKCMLLSAATERGFLVNKLEEKDSEALQWELAVNVHRLTGLHPW